MATALIFPIDSGHVMLSKVISTCPSIRIALFTLLQTNGGQFCGAPFLSLLQNEGPIPAPSSQKVAELGDESA